MISLKKAVVTILVVIVAGIAYWLVELGGAKDIFGRFRRAKIEKVSLGRPGTPMFVTGETIRFSLVSVEPDKVIWYFDEQDIVPGNVQIDHAFPFDSTKKKGLHIEHRIDAFFKSGSEYQTAVEHVTTENTQLVSVNTDQRKIVISSDPAQGTGWVLRAAYLGKFEDGTFKSGTPLATEMDPHHGTARISFSASVVAGANPCLPSKDAERSVVSLEWVQPKGNGKLETVESLYGPLIATQTSCPIGPSWEPVALEPSKPKQ